MWRGKNMYCKNCQCHGINFLSTHPVRSGPRQLLAGAPPLKACASPRSKWASLTPQKSWPSPRGVRVCSRWRAEPRRPLSRGVPRQVPLRIRHTCESTRGGIAIVCCSLLGFIQTRALAARPTPCKSKVPCERPCCRRPGPRYSPSSSVGHALGHLLICPRAGRA